MELRIPPSRLERRVRLLLRLPKGYRADRGEELLGTLLEATPDGRDWPAARDCWSLLAGGARARRASNLRRRRQPAAGGCPWPRALPQLDVGGVLHARPAH